MRLCLGTAKGIVILDPDRRGAPVMVLADPSSIRCMAQDARQPELIYAGSSQATHIGDSAGSGMLSRSSDGGRTWSDITPRGAREEEVFAVATSPHRPGEVLIGTSYARLFKSEDSGHSFEESRNLSERVRRAGRGCEPSALRSICYAQAHPKTVCLAIDGCGVMLSREGADDFQPLANRLPAEIHQVGVHPTDPAIIVLTTAAGLYVSTDQGARWRRTGRGISRSFLMPLMLCAANPGIVLTAGAAGPPSQWHDPFAGADAQIFVSRDDGNTFRALETGGSLRGMVNAFGQDLDEPSRCFAVTSDGAVLMLLDYGEEVIELASRLPPIYGIATVP